MGQTRRACLFCGDEGTSREHIVAKWIGRALALPAIPGIDIVYRHVSENREAGIARHEKQANAPAFYTRGFCQTCNTGWMSRLESAVRPILGPLLLGQARALHSGDQQTLAFWVTKTILAFQSVEAPVTTFARPEDFTHLHRQRAPLPTTQIWLGANPEGEPAWYQAHTVFRRGSSQADGFGATFTVGHAVFYFLHGYAAPIGMRLRYPPALLFNEIWPARRDGFLWPPRTQLPSEHRHGLAAHLAGHCVLLAA